MENYQNYWLIVTAEASEVTVVITGRNGTFPYDGTEKSVKGYDVSITQGSTYTEADFTFSGKTLMSVHYFLILTVMTTLYGPVLIYIKPSREISHCQ